MSHRASDILCQPGRHVVPLPRRGGASTAVARARALWRHWHGRLLLWQRRAATRRTMLLMSDHILKDVGLSRLDALREAEKPFWRS